MGVGWPSLEVSGPGHEVTWGARILWARAGSIQKENKGQHVLTPLRPMTDVKD